MQLSLTPDQEFFRDNTSKFLTERATPTEIRRLRDEPDGYDDRYWRQGAELGWTSLLVAEEHGGGSISGDGLGDLALVADEFGRHAAPGPLVPTNVVAGALSNLGADRHGDLLAGLLNGTSIASWGYLEPRPHQGLDDLALEIREDGSELVVRGIKRPVESAGRASHLLIAGRTGRGWTQILVPTDTEGISVWPMRTVDLTRRFAEVAFEDVRVPIEAAFGEVGGAAHQIERQFLQAVVMANAETVGAMQTAFAMTLEWAFDRYSFGRPLASYQELKHRFADMKTWLEAGHAISDMAAQAVSAGSPEATELASAAKAFLGQYGTELLQDCVQMHGGIGLTFEHDIHFYLRRVTLDRTLHGTPSEHRARIARIVSDHEDAA